MIQQLVSSDHRQAIEDWHYLDDAGILLLICARLPKAHIEAGKTASMVLSEANPLQDIRNTERIAAVISEGRYLDRATLDRLLHENCLKCPGDAAH